MDNYVKMSSSPNRAVAFLRCSSCRFAALYFVPFCGGLAQAGRATAGYLALGALFWFLLSLGIEITNRLTDRTEDAINRPERTALCNQVGWRTLNAMQLVIWCAVLVLDIAWLALAGNPLLLGLMGASAAIGIGYSRGARLSRRRLFAFVTLNLLFGGSFLLGWSVGYPFGHASSSGWHQLADFIPLLIIVGLFILALVGIKDITDREGDLRIGYRSFFVDLVERQSSALLGFLVSMPFLAVLVFALSGLLPARLLTLLVFAPISAMVVCATRQAKTSLDQLLVREAFYDYWLIFSSSALLLLLPRLTLAGAIAGALVYWMIATRWLHWGAPLRLAGLGRIVQLASSTTSRRTMASTTATH